MIFLVYPGQSFNVRTFSGSEYHAQTCAEDWPDVNYFFAELGPIE